MRGKLCRVLMSAMTLIAIGCSSSRTAVSDETAASGNEPVQRRFENVVELQRPWSQLQVPVKLSITRPTKFSISGRMYMIRDKRIYLSMRFFGMEVATLDIQSDSIHFYDKYHKKYVADDISSILAGASVSISDIQDLLLGRMFDSGNGELTGKSIGKFTLGSGDDNWSATPRKAIHGVSYTFVFNKLNDVLERISAKVGNQLLTAEYSSAVENEFGRFMQGVSIDVGGKTPVKAGLSATFKSVKWKVDANGWDDRPTGYERMSISSLLSKLKF